MKENVRETMHESLKCVLTNEDIKRLGEQIAQAVARKAEAEADLKSVATQLKSKIAAEDAIITSNSEKIRSGYEWRNVECERIKDYQAGVVTIYRNDTGELVSERKMSYEERQHLLPLGIGNMDPQAEGMQTI